MQILTGLFILILAILFEGCALTKSAGQKPTLTLNKTNLTKTGDGTYRLNMKNAVTNTAIKSAIIDSVKKSEPVTSPAPKPQVQKTGTQTEPLAPRKGPPKGPPKEFLKETIKEKSNDAQAAAARPNSQQIGEDEMPSAVTILSDGTFAKNQTRRPIGLFLYYLTAALFLSAAYMAYTYYIKFKETEERSNPFTDKDQRVHLGEDI